MKKSGKRSASLKRTGASIIYVLAYMTLTAGLLASSGAVLHSLLTATSTDQRLFREIHTIERAARDLRADADKAVAGTLASDVMQVDQGHRVTATWTIDDHVLSQETRTDQRLRSRQQYRFRHGTQLAFQRDTEYCVVLRIDPPPLAYLPSTATPVASRQLGMEIVLALPVGDQEGPSQ